MPVMADRIRRARMKLQESEMERLTVVVAQQQEEISALMASLERQAAGLQRLSSELKAGKTPVTIVADI